MNQLRQVYHAAGGRAWQRAIHLALRNGRSSTQVIFFTTKRAKTTKFFLLELLRKNVFVGFAVFVVKALVFSRL
jgi:hypothetical protein